MEAEDSSLGTLLERLDRNPVRRGAQFEQICRWFLLNEPVYQAQINRVWNWSRWPGRWGPDAGIDLVAETCSGELWAIQCKAYGYSYSITKAGIDSFLSESNRPEFSYRLLIATTNRIGRAALNVIRGQEKAAGCLLLSDLRASEVVWPTSPLGLEASTRKPHRLRVHQREAVDAVLAGFASGESRGQLVMACGTGKTLSTLRVREALGAPKTIVFVPSLSLMKQTIKEWLAHRLEGFEFIPVCSDASVSKADASIHGVSDLGFPVTTRSDDVARFLERDGSGVVFCTYQSSGVLVEALSGRPPIDLVIADEAHRCAGSCDGTYSDVLSDEKVPAKHRLFVTATPRRYIEGARRAAKDSGVVLASMDDPALFGRVFFRLSLREAIRRDLLSDYHVLVIGVSQAEYKDSALRAAAIRADGVGTTDARTLSSQIALAKAIRRFDLRRVLTFHGRVSHAKEFSKSFPDVVNWMQGPDRPSGRLWNRYVSGAMNAGERSVRLDELRDVAEGERGVISNARCLSEGIDVPSIDGIAFIDPRRSSIDITQAVGRAIRKSEGKKAGVIVLPVYILPGEDAEQALGSSDFKDVAIVLRALREHDEELGQELAILRREFGERGSISESLPERIELCLPEEVGQEFSAAFSVEIVKKTTTSLEGWHGEFLRLRQFAEENGHASPLWDYLSADGFPLGRWVYKNRHKLKHAEAGNAQRSLLESLPGWSWDKFDEAWANGYAHLRQYQVDHGATVVPQDHVCGDGFKLGTWLAGVRSRYKKHSLRGDQIALLEMFPDWSWAPKKDLFEIGRSHLNRFVENHGHARVPKDYLGLGGFKLGNWVATRRNMRSRGMLSSRDEQLLDELGFVWNALDDQWDQSFASLVEFVETNGRARPSQAYVDAAGRKLGTWVTLQRKLFQEGRLDSDRQLRLEALDGWVWNPTEAEERERWEARFAMAKEYLLANEGKGVPVDCRVGDGVRLGRWVSAQRKRFRDGKLDQDRIRLLESLPGWVWDGNAARWEEGFRHATEYAQKHGSIACPSDYETDCGFSLGNWLGHQRRKGRKNQLSIQELERLSALPGWAVDRQDPWEIGYASLLEYQRTHGHVLVRYGDTISDGYPIGQWVTTQRQKFRLKQLSSDQARRLEGLDGWLWRVELGQRSNEVHVAQWEQMFLCLEAYVQAHGTTVVDEAKLSDGNRSLGNWVQTQRVYYKNGKLGIDRAQRLERLADWDWAPRSNRWESGFLEFVAFVGVHKHGRVPALYKNEDGFSLGSWVRSQRRRYQSGRMPEGLVRKLESVPEWSWKGPRSSR